MSSFRLLFRSRKYLVSAVFYLCFSVLFSTWVTYIPYVCEKLSLSEGQFGAALFFSALGSFITIPIANALVNKIGVGRIVFYALFYFAFSVLMPLLAFSYTSLCIGLFLLGSGSCLFNISINSLTGTLEKQDKVMIMSTSHGFFSAGGMLGASLGGVIAAFFHNPLLHFGIIAFLLVAFQVYNRKYYFNVKSEKIKHSSVKLISFKPLVLIALVGLILMVAEGAIADWSALYLKRVVHVEAALFGFGFAAFAFAMTMGRFIGDWISRKFGSWQIIMGGSIVSLFGFFLILVAHLTATLIGFSVVGLGFSIIVPEIYRMAARTKNIETSTGVAFIAGVANIGFLVGPVLLGFLAELRSLRFSFFALACFVVIAILISVYQVFKRKTIVQ